MSQTASQESPLPLPSTFHLTYHAAWRMTGRHITSRAVWAALLYGRVVTTRDAEISVIGRREVRALRREGVDLSPYEGVHVVCAPDGAILTVYRSRDLRGLCPRRPGHKEQLS